MSWIVALLACWLAGTPALAATIQSIDAGHGRIVVRFDAPVAAVASMILDGPRRVRLDVDGAGPGGTVQAGGVVTRVAQVAHGSTGVRLTLNLNQPAVVTGGGLSGDGRTLTLTLGSVSPDAFAQASDQGATTFAAPGSASVGQAGYSVTMAVPPPAAAAPLPRIWGDDPSRPLVVIDPGHGGHDPGAISPDTGLMEKTLTLKIARAIRDQLVASGRVRVALTRDSDRYLELRERYGVARRLHADLFISIHCDSAGTTDAAGATAYTLSEVASDKEAARLAADENRADMIAGIDPDRTTSDVSSLLIDLTQRETMNVSSDFAQLLGREAKPLMPIKDNFHRMASLMVLKAPDMPSILFETGYISNPEQAAFLNSADGEQRIAQSVADAVAIHFARRLTDGGEIAAK